MTDTVTIPRQTEGAPSALVAVGDITQMVSPPLSASTPAQWARRYAKHPRRPFPRGWKTSGGMVWVRDEVETWLRETGRL